jgi:hypothetical protein
MSKEINQAAPSLKRQIATIAGKALKTWFIVLPFALLKFAVALIGLIASNEAKELKRDAKDVKTGIKEVGEALVYGPGGSPSELKKASNTPQSTPRVQTLTDPLSQKRANRRKKFLE